MKLLQNEVSLQMQPYARAAIALVSTRGATKPRKLANVIAEAYYEALREGAARALRNAKAMKAAEAKR
jgi:preprotein translocase subunit SecB